MDALRRGEPAAVAWCARPHGTCLTERLAPAPEPASVGPVRQWHAFSWASRCAPTYLDDPCCGDVDRRHQAHAHMRAKW
eukprot:3801369-Prymnesium_polylepis.1